MPNCRELALSRPNAENHRRSDRPPAPSKIVPRRPAGVDAKEAARRLDQARLERARGAQPQAGELTTDAGARTVNYRYWQRQVRLRQAVEKAQQRSNETLRAQIAAR